MSTALLEACAPVSAPGPAPQGDKIPKGGTMSEAPSTEAPHVNPLRVQAPVGATLMYDGLLALQPDGSLIPLLAAALPKTSADGTTYTFDLRKDVKWTDGTPLTADDVVFTYKLLYHPDNKAFLTPYRASLESIIADVTAPDKNTVVIKTKIINAPFLTVHGRYGVVPKHILGTVKAADLDKHPFNTAPSVTSGAYKFKEWVKGSHMTLVRNEGFYRGAPHLDTYTIKFMPQANIILALKSGDLDAAVIAQPQAYDDLKTVSHLQSTFLPTPYSCPRVGFNMTPGSPGARFFSSKAVRQALAYAADREGAAKATLFGYALKPASTGVFNPASWANKPTTGPAYDYDPKKAEAMLDAEGWRRGPSGIREKNGLQMKWDMLNSATNNTWMQIGQVFVETWKKIGVDVTNKGVQYPQLVTLWQSREFDMAMVQPPHELQADPDPSGAYHSRNAVKGTGTNYTMYRNAEVDKLLDDAVATLDRAKRKELYWKAQDIINEEVPFFASWFWQGGWILNKRIGYSGSDQTGQFFGSNRPHGNLFYSKDGK